jgi:hypothetical protein
MAFDVPRIQAELAARPLHSPVPLDLAIAVVNDVLRDADTVVLVDEAWLAWQRRGEKLWPEQMGMLAHALSVTSMLAATIEAVHRLTEPRPLERLQGFFRAIAPLTAEMLRANAFRQEEMIRRWAEAWEAPIAAERPAQSARRLDQLDYRKALRELERAEQARKAEADRRERLLQEAREREAAARAWRE